MASAFSREYLVQQLVQNLGESLSDQEIERCLIGVEIVEPPAAKQFWQAATAPNGIYIVLGGKVRILDSSNNLITTLTTGASFGELTLFTEQNLSDYVARASVNLKLAYFPQASLQEVIRKYPSIRHRLQQRAELWDLLLLCCQSGLVPDNGSTEGVLQALSLFERHNLEGDSLPVGIFQDTKLWLLHQGELP